MNLHKDAGMFNTVLEKMHEKSGYRLDVLEKDYYVVLMLKELSEKQKVGLPAYFKGGTALYKSLKNAKRFSEDIDLSVDTRGCSGSQNKKRLNLATKEYGSMVRDAGSGRTNKSEVIAYYTYEPIVEYDRDDTLDRFGRMMIEATSFTISEPVSEMEITPLIYDLSSDEEKAELTEGYGVMPFLVKAITIERIFVDKLFAAEAYVRKSTEENRAFDAGKHIYDLSVMTGMPKIQRLMADDVKMKELLDIRMEEEMSRLDGIPGVRPSEFTFFDSVAGNKLVEHEYANMQRVYVFREEDRIAYSIAMNKLEYIQRELSKNRAWVEYRPSLMKRLEVNTKIAEEQEYGRRNGDKQRSAERRIRDVIE